MPETNARLREIAPGVVAERLATETHLFWNPEDDKVTIAFQTSEHLYVNEQWQPFGPAVGGDVLEASMDDIYTRTFATGLNDPVTGVDLSGVTPAGETVTNTISISITCYLVDMAAIVPYRSGGGPTGYSVHGIELQRDGGAANGTETWVTPASSTVGDKFEVKFEHVSGASVGGSPALGAYGVINSRRYCNLEGTGSAQAVVSVTIRGIGMGGIGVPSRDISLDIS